MSNLLSQASLVMIPSGYKEDIVYCPVPTNGNGDLSFTRASNGTRINSAGLVEVCPWNLLQYSEDFSNGAWSKINATVTSNTTTAPNGTTTADTLEKLGGSGGVNYYYIVQNTNSFEQLTNFFYVKHKSGSGIVWILGLNSGTFAFFDVINGTALSKSSGMTTSIESVGNGWYKCIVSQNYQGASSTTYGIGLCLVDGTPNYDATSAATQSVYIWGAQSSVSSTAKPYFPTTDRLNVPRLTYQNGGGGCPSLLLEKQSTNDLLYSEQFDNAGWSKEAATSTANQTTSPDGTQNADTIVDNSTSGRHIFYQQFTGNLATSRTFSLYAKQNSLRYLFMSVTNAGDADCYSAIFDLQSGTVSATKVNGDGTISASIVNAGNGWYRCIISGTMRTGNNSYFPLIGTSDRAGFTGSLFANNAPLYSGSGQSLFIYGAQLEESSYPTSYIPTTSSSATRLVDYPSRSGLALTNSTFAVNFKPLDYVVELFDFVKTGGGRMFYIAVQSNGFITFNSVSGGTIGAIGSVLPKKQTCKLAFSLNASTSNVKVYINGSIIGTYATNITTFGAFLGLQSFGYVPGTQIEQIAIFPSVLTDAECQALTTI